MTSTQGTIMPTTITLTQDYYEPLTLPGGDVDLRNDHAGGVTIAEVTPGTTHGERVVVRLLGNNGTPPVYLGTQGTQSMDGWVDRAMPVWQTPADEVAVLTWDGTQSKWLVTWE